MTGFTTHNGFDFKEICWTPTMAREALDRTDSTWNRKTRPPKVSEYLDDMKNGLWGFCDVPVIFTPEDNIIQGKHRLTALALCPDDVTVWFFTIRGVPRRLIGNLDNTVKRTVGDQLALLHGISDANNKAAAARAIRRWHASDGGLTAEVSNNQVIRFAIKHDDLLGTLLHETRLAGKRTTLTTGICAPVWWEMHQVSPVMCTRFWRALGAEEAEGIRDPDRDQPIAAIRSQFKVNSRGQAPGRRWSQGVLIKGWNAWRDHRQIGIVRLRDEESFPQLRDN